MLLKKCVKYFIDESIENIKFLLATLSFIGSGVILIMIYKCIPIIIPIIMNYSKIFILTKFPNSIIMYNTIYNIILNLIYKCYFGLMYNVITRLPIKILMNFILLKFIRFDISSNDPSYLLITLIPLEMWMLYITINEFIVINFQNNFFYLNCY